MRKLIKRLFVLLAILVALGATTFAGLYFYISPNLPSIEALKDVRFQVPLRVYTADEKLIAEFGEKKRTPVSYAEVPQQLVQAVLAAEDDRFFEHAGVDYQGLLRAGWKLLTTGERAQGGSTITMQVARNFFLTTEKTFARKFTEIFLAFKIERELSKEEILTLYLNKIYLGNRAYGITAAAQVYYGKTLGELTLAESAMLAGLPKAPSAYNPIANIERALIRRDYVLSRMRELDYIAEAAFDEAKNSPDTAELHSPVIEAHAPYVAEMVRQAMFDKYGEEAYNAGLSVYTTIDTNAQLAANKAVHEGLLNYDQRHGYRGPLGHIDLAILPPEQWPEQLSRHDSIGPLLPGIVTNLTTQEAEVMLKKSRITIAFDDLKWARSFSKKKGGVNTPADILSVGDIIMVHELEPGRWQLAQTPQAQAALVSLDTKSGAIIALVGGFDFFHSKFNRVTQAKRLPGSSFKPFIYSAALDKGYTAASIINDAPIVLEDASLETQWRPENYSGDFYGPTRLREALTHSRNLVSIRLLDAIGIDYALEHVKKFGFNTTIMPRNLSLSLGTADLTPLELARGHAVFANGGYLVEPYFIKSVVDANGNVVEQAPTVSLCDTPCEAHNNQSNATGAVKLAPRVLSAQNAYVMTSIMQDVIQYGTAQRAKALNRTDLAGKTGTTNDQHDAWFAGFNRDVLAISWVGFDEPKSLGAKETGGRASLPIWIHYMKAVLGDKPASTLEMPEGVVTLRIDPQTGLRAPAESPDAIFEVFNANDAPTQWANTTAPAQETAPTSSSAPTATAPASSTDQLF